MEARSLRQPAPRCLMCMSFLLSLKARFVLHKTIAFVSLGIYASVSNLLSAFGLFCHIKSRLINNERHTCFWINRYCKVLFSAKLFKVFLANAKPLNQVYAFYLFFYKTTFFFNILPRLHSSCKVYEKPV